MDASPNRRVFKFQFEDSEVQFSSDFESGNLRTVQQTDPLTYDIVGSPDTESASKSCPYFAINGFPMGTRVKIRLRGMAILHYFYTAESAKTQKPDTSYQLCLRKGEGDWERLLEGTVLEMTEDKDLVLSFSYTFWTTSTTEFAFNYPYTYRRHEWFYDNIKNMVEDQPGELVYQDQTLAMSKQGRGVRLISITNNNQPAYTKPVILITARVHPSESPSSYAAEGIVNFLINRQDLRSQRLRNTFVVMLIPMLNPDGVAMGNFRYDDMAQNLNRHYLKPDPVQQPTIFAAKTVIEQLNTRIMFYFDLHAHHSPKGCFIYGNFLQNFVKHVEAQTFCRVMALNNSDFEYQYCNFSEEQMGYKDRQEVKTKEGCGRVVVHRLANVLHSYTVECGYYRSNQINEPTKQSNTDYTEGEFSCTKSDNIDCERIYSTSNYREIGRDLMISVADILGLNPYSKIAKSQFRDMESLRRMVSSGVFYGDQRFRRTDMNVLHKLKNINHLIKLLYNQWHFQSPLKLPIQDQRRKDDMNRRTQTQLRYYKDIAAARRNTKVSDIPGQELEEEIQKFDNREKLTTIATKQEYASQSLEKQYGKGSKLSNAGQTGRRVMRITSVAMNEKKEVTPIKPCAPFAYSQLKLNISSEKNSSELKHGRNMLKMSSRRITKTDPGIEPERRADRLDTEQQQQALSQHKRSVNVQFRVAGPESLRREIIVGRTLSTYAGQNSLIRCYQNARKRVAAINRPDQRVVFKLPKLQSLVQVKARIIQQCRLEYVLKAPVQQVAGGTRK